MFRLSLPRHHIEKLVTPPRGFYQLNAEIIEWLDNQFWDEELGVELNKNATVDLYWGTNPVGEWYGSFVAVPEIHLSFSCRKMAMHFKLCWL